MCYYILNWNCFYNYHLVNGYDHNFGTIGIAKYLQKFVRNLCSLYKVTLILTKDQFGLALSVGRT
jgi:hypothetical protein